MARKKRREPDEFALIARFFRPLAAGEKGAFALTDDAAVLDIPRDRRLVATTDCLVEGVHFLKGAAPEDIAPKLLRANLSDLAAMGAEPRWYLLAAAFARGTRAAWIRRFARALHEEQRRFGVVLAGGDTVAAPGRASFTVTALGMVGKGAELRRSGARAGDDVYVSGTIGDAALGLSVLKGELRVAARHARFLIERYHRPTPRIALGRFLVGVAHSAIDVSDGLVADLGHVCETSRVGAVIEAAALPLSSAARAALRAAPELLADVLAGGDDYELVFTAPKARRPRIRALARALGLSLTRIGRIAGAGGRAARVRVMEPDGKPYPLPRTGWRHF
ncbi:MAG: thiamine-phosphate kinase [Pseudomonadota bacterium]